MYGMVWYIVLELVECPLVDPGRKYDSLDKAVAVCAWNVYGEMRMLTTNKQDKQTRKGTWT